MAGWLNFCSSGDNTKSKHVRSRLCSTAALVLSLSTCCSEDKRESGHRLRETGVVQSSFVGLVVTQQFCVAKKGQSARKIENLLLCLDYVEAAVLARKMSEPYCIVRILMLAFC